MKRSLTLLFAALALSGCASAPARALPGAEAPAPEFQEVKKIAEVLPYLEKRDPKRTLVVFDIDDTLLKSERFYGSDTWYRWQASLPDGTPDKVPCLFELIGINYDALSLVATERDGAANFAIQAISADKLLLTSRSPYDRGSTVRQLEEAGFDVKFDIGTPKAGFIFRCGLEQNPKDPTDPCLEVGPKEKGRLVSYFEGLFMVSGLNKGKALRSLLKRRGVSYDFVVLVDDTLGNLRDMKEAMKDAGIAFVGLQYTGVVKPDVTDLGILADGRAGREEVSHFLSHLSSSRSGRLRAGTCFSR